MEKVSENAREKKEGERAKARTLEKHFILVERAKEKTQFSPSKSALHLPFESQFRQACV